MKKAHFLSIAVVVAALLATPIGQAFADAPSQAGARLENLLKREQILLSNQQQRLDWTGQAIAKAEEWIANLKSRGRDTAPLESALAAFQAGVAEARPFFDTAKSVLDAKAGFDAAGKVTNRAEALRTVVDAGRAQRQFHLKITQATLDFRAAVRAYLQANK